MANSIYPAPQSDSERPQAAASRPCDQARESSARKLAESRPHTGRRDRSQQCDHVEAVDGSGFSMSGFG